MWNFCCFLLSTATTIVFSIDESTELVELCPVLYLNGMTGSEQHAEEWHGMLSFSPGQEMPLISNRLANAVYEKTMVYTVCNFIEPALLLLLRYFA